MEPTRSDALELPAKVDTTLNVYTQVIQESVRAAAQKIGDELFTIVHNPEGTPELTH